MNSLLNMMNTIKSYVFIRWRNVLKKKIMSALLVFFVLVMFAGCGKEKGNAIVEDSVVKEESATDENTDTDDVRVMDAVEDNTAIVESTADDEQIAVTEPNIDETEENISVIHDASSFESDVCGTYRGEDGDEGEERYWDISCIDGKYYLDYISDYDFTAAEIELLDENAFLVDDELRYMVKVYPFSTFAFCGEYQGGGEVMYISSKVDSPKKQIELSADNPFFHKSQCLYDAEGVNLHKVQDKSEVNNVAPEIIGAWRDIVKIEGEETNIFVQFMEDGHIDIVRKSESYTPDVFRGIYTLEKDGDKYIGKIEAECIGMGSQPMADWILEFDPASDNPITIRDEFLEGTPLAYGVDLALSRTEPGAYDSSIRPGPCDRTDEVVKMYNEYIMCE